MTDPTEWNPTEAIYAFAGWLAARSQPVTMSARHDAAVVANLIEEFRQRHGLPQPRAGWEEAMVADAFLGFEPNGD